MDKGLLQNIIDDFKGFNKNTLLIENNDGFLFRKDIRSIFESAGINIILGTQLEQRIAFELKSEDKVIALVTKDKVRHLEDIRSQSVAFEFSIAKYLPAYHIPTIIKLDIEVLDQLFMENQLFLLNQKETKTLVEYIVHKLRTKIRPLDLTSIEAALNNELSKITIDWDAICHLISKSIPVAILSGQMKELKIQINQANEHFQQYLESSYKQKINSSAIKKPQIVSKILEYLSFNFSDEKLALIVVDGLSYWQYELFADQISGIKDQQVIFSWLPSITQLSRQAIFRGNKPTVDYIQNPTNESKLWSSFWKDKGLDVSQIGYSYGGVDFKNIHSITKLAIVYKDLDAHMHHSPDYSMLFGLTKDWIGRSQIVSVINRLRSHGFKVFLTTDHGNIEAIGWRGLKGREKLGTNKSGSLSTRHIEYSEKWLTEEFLYANQDIKDVLKVDDHTIYFQNDFSFSNEPELVTHGGSHILEVLIPFIEIEHE
jgi:hypothetical protein